MKAVGPSPTIAGTCPADIRLGHRVWLQDGGTPVFGVGICELLRRVETTGSLRRAALDMGMAYSKAWQIVRRAEDHLGFKLMVRRTGGRGGGWSTVSDEGRWLVRSFEALTEEADPLLADLFGRHFHAWPGAPGTAQADVEGESVRGNGV